MELLLIPGAFAAVILTGIALRYLDNRKKRRAQSLRDEFLGRVYDAEQEVSTLPDTGDQRIAACVETAKTCLRKAQTSHDFDDLTRCSLHTRAGEIAINWAKALQKDDEVDWQDGWRTNTLMEALSLVALGQIDRARSTVSKYATSDEVLPLPFPVVQAAHDVEILCLFQEGKYDEATELAESGPTLYVHLDDEGS